MNSEPDWIGGQQEDSEIMDFMDIDQVVEVPDTPDRLVAPCNNDSNNIRNMNDTSKSYRVVNDPREKSKSVTINGNRRLFVRPDNCSHSSSSKTVLPAVENALQEKGKASCNSNIQRSSSFVDLTEQNGRSRVSGNTHASEKCVLSANGVNGNLKIGPRSDLGKGVAVRVQQKPENGPFPLGSTSPGVARQKRLVRNGCISPHNIAKSKQVSEKHDAGAMASGGPLGTVDIKDLVTEAKGSRRFKGKGVSHHPSSPQRNSGVLKEASDASKDIEPDGWRTTHNPMRKVELPLLDGDSRILRGTGALSSIIDQQDGVVQSDHINGSISSNLNNHFEDLEIVSAPPETLSRRAHQLGQFKERAQLTKRQREGVGSSSVSCVNDSEIVFLSPPEGPSTSRTTRNKNRRGVATLDPVIALDELSPEPGNHGSNTTHSRNEDSGVRALQVEADELLARELQEQLYNEELAPAFGVDDGSSIRAGGRPPSRGSSGSNLFQHSRSNPSRNPSVHRGDHVQALASTRLARLRGRFPGRPRTLSSTTTTRNSIFPPNMNVDMRMQILEALEAFNDMELPNDLLQAGREFNENDYEILLALDENNHQHGGATRGQINNLPESTVQAENLQECAICLETPTIGETIRHLPCLHRFHKDCIDQWLRRKTSCPVCKSSIT